MGRSSYPSWFFSAEEKDQILAAIRAAEAKTSGEIRVHLDRRCKAGDPQVRAKKVFESLRMDRTADHNGVLVYLAIRDRVFSVIGDAGIDAKVEAPFWDGVRDRMGTAFARDAFGEGIAVAIGEIGDRLAENFPRKAGDVNELSNDISTGKVGG